MFRATFILGLWLGAGVLAAADDPASAAYYSNPARDIEFSNVQHLGRSPRILLPTVHVKFQRWGRVPLSLDGTSTGGAIVDIDVPVSVDAIRDLAARLQADLTKHLESAGWEVLGEAEIKDNAAWTKAERVNPDRRFGVPFEQGTTGGNPRRYLIVPPGELPVIAAGATGPAWALKELVGELNATVLVPTYTFDVIPAVTGGSRPVTPRLQLVEVNLDFRTPGLVGGMIRTKVAQISQKDSGTFSVPGVKEDRLQQALEEIAGGRGKRELVLEPDAEALVASAFEVGSGFNSQAVGTVSAFAPK